MPSIISTLLRGQIRLMKPVLQKMTLETNRAMQDKLGELGTEIYDKGLAFEPVQLPRCGAELILPKNIGAEHVALYLHGGGYNAGSMKYARGFGSILAIKLNFPVLSVAYRLAPENPFPAALDDALDAYRYLLQEGYAPGKIFLVGESAGGGLIFCLLHRLREMQIPFPAKVVAISPWADLTMTSASCRENEEKDPCLSRDGLAYFAELYAGKDLENPLVSPIYGDFSDFPPALIFVGTHECLLDDAIAIKERYDACKRPATLQIEEGLWHVYVLFPVPEAAAALEKIQVFLG